MPRFRQPLASPENLIRKVENKAQQQQIWKQNCPVVVADREDQGDLENIKYKKNKTHDGKYEIYPPPFLGYLWPKRHVLDTYA